MNATPSLRNLRRFWSGYALDPNEARLVFDISISVFAGLAALVFERVFLSNGSFYYVAFFSALFIVACYLLGIYSRFRTARSSVKSFLLIAAAAISIIGGTLVGASAPYSFIWAVITVPLTVTARFLLNLSSSRDRNLFANTARKRGKTLVIGGAGYIGSHVVDQLLKKGESVRVLDRLMYGPDSLAEFRSNRNFEVIEGDVSDIAKLTDAMRGVSTVVHLAGLVGDPACAVDPEFTRHTNTIVTRMAKQVAQAMGVSRFIFASSCSVYGCSDVEVDENSSLNPVSLYAQTKIDSERELLADLRDDFTVTILRFATVFGHSFRPRFDLVANLFTAQAVNDGVITVVGPDQWRPFIHCRDLARAIVMTIEAPEAKVQGQIFNVGDERLNLTILKLGETVRDVVKKTRPDVQLTINSNIQDRRNYMVSFKRIQSVLGYRAATLMDAGVTEMVENFSKSVYQSYKSETYSNVAVTRKVVEKFHDPANVENLYAPLSVGNGS